MATTVPTTAATAPDEGEEEWITQRDTLKSTGDKAYSQGDFAQAIQHYTAALQLDPTFGPLLSNRSAAHLRNNEKSKALADAVACKETMGVKGMSRHAAALQALGRWGVAKEEWENILREQPEHAAAQKGVKDCERALESIQKTEEEEAKQEADKTAEPADQEEEEEEDPLADFFSQAETAAQMVTKEKEAEATSATTQILSQKQSLGTVESHVERLVHRSNATWYNLNPFVVLDLPHTADAAEIGRRYKALSLLLHPDKNPSIEQAQAAFDIVKDAKTQLLQDPDKAQHVRDLVDTGYAQGKGQWERDRKIAGCASAFASLQDYQEKATYKLFADLEVKRRRAEKNTRAYEQREKEQEDAAVTSEQKERQFHKQWKKEDRVDQRIGNWRDFQKKKKRKTEE